MYPRELEISSWVSITKDIAEKVIPHVSAYISLTDVHGYLCLTDEALRIPEVYEFWESIDHTQFALGYQDQLTGRVFSEPRTSSDIDYNVIGVTYSDTDYETLCILNLIGISPVIKISVLKKGMYTTNNPIIFRRVSDDWLYFLRDGELEKELKRSKK